MRKGAPNSAAVLHRYAKTRKAAPPRFVRTIAILSKIRCLFSLLFRPDLHMQVRLCACSSLLYVRLPLPSALMLILPPSEGVFPFRVGPSTARREGVFGTRCGVLQFAIPLRYIHFACGFRIWLDEFVCKQLWGVSPMLCKAGR